MSSGDGSGLPSSANDDDDGSEDVEKQGKESVGKKVRRSKQSRGQEAVVDLNKS